MNLMSLDLELNQPSKSIIQIGIAVGDLDTGDILTTGCWNIQVNEIISDYITTLTGITQDDVDNGNNLYYAYNKLCQIHTNYECLRNPITWGSGDSEALRKELEKDDDSFIFGRRWIDAKTVYVSSCLANNRKYKGGLSSSLSKLNMKFEGQKHNAKDDAVNTFRIYHRLLQDLKRINDNDQ